MEDLNFLDILKDQVTPALGCTEPIAVALAVAKARETLGSFPDKIKIKVDRNIFKNALAVGIPGTKEKGLHMAVALALLAGKSEYGLEVLKDITSKDVLKAKEIIKRNIIDVTIARNIVGLYVEVEAFSNLGKTKVIIKDKHDNIVIVQRNDQVIFKKAEAEQQQVSLIQSMKKMRIRDFVEFADRVDIKLLDLVEKGIKMNKKIAEAGMASKYGKVLGDGLSVHDMDYKDYAKYLTSVASFARMSGYPLPVMSCAGSGNHGLTAILPVVAVGEKKRLDPDKLIRGVALSLLVTIYVKSFTGTLSPVCGCGVAAGVGASAGITYILGGSIEQIEGAIKNMIGTLAGIICDGGKPGCAFKLSVSVDAAIECAMMALNDVVISSDDGIVDETAEKTVYNLGKVSTEGMATTDEAILGVMMGKCM